MANTDSTSTGDGSSAVRVEVADVVRSRSLHGAWWPRSDDPAVELGALADALPSSLGRVARVALSRTGWSAAPNLVERRNARDLRVGWFTVVDPNVLTVVLVDGTRLRLLIVPPGSPEDAANAAMHAATSAEEQHQSPETFLSDAGVPDIPQARSGDGMLFAGSDR